MTETSFVCAFPDAANLLQFLIQPMEPGNTFDGNTHVETWTLIINGGLRSQESYSKTLPTDIGGYSQSTGEAHDLDITVLAGDTLEVKCTGDSDVNSVSNGYLVGITGNWLRS